MFEWSICRTQRQNRLFSESRLRLYLSANNPGQEWPLGTLVLSRGALSVTRVSCTSLFWWLSNLNIWILARPLLAFLSASTVSLFTRHHASAHFPIRKGVCHASRRAASSELREGDQGISYRLEKSWQCHEYKAFLSPPSRIKFIPRRCTDAQVSSLKNGFPLRANFSVEQCGRLLC